MLSFWIVQAGFWGLRRMLIWPSCFRRLEVGGGSINFTFFGGEGFDFGTGFEEGEFEVVDVGVCSNYGSIVI
jgi:hypothetical protein